MKLITKKMAVLVLQAFTVAGILVGLLTGLASMILTCFIKTPHSRHEG